MKIRVFREQQKSSAKEQDLKHCVDPFKSRPLYGDTLYLRLHGVKGYTYDYRYSDEELESLAGWAEEKPTYFMFNNSNLVAATPRCEL